MNSESHTHEHQHDGCCGHDHSAGAPHAHVHVETERKFFFGLEFLVLLTWGAVLIYYVGSGRVKNLLAETGIFREQALIGGLALLVLALFNFTMRNRFAGCGHDHDEAEGEAVHHHHEEAGWMGRLTTIVILTVPIVLAAVFNPDSYSDDYKRNQVNAAATSQAATGPNALTKNLKSPDAKFSLDDFKKYCAPNAEGNFPLSVSDLWSLAGDPDVRGVLEGQTVETTGQVVPDTAATKGNRMRIFELQMVCCSADSRPVAFPVEFADKAPEFREMGWYRIVGKVSFEDHRGGKMTVIKATDMQPTTKPQGSAPAI